MYSEIITKINNKGYLDLGTAIVNCDERYRKGCEKYQVNSPSYAINYKANKEGVHDNFYWHGVRFCEGVHIKKKDIEKINTCLLFNKPSNSFYVEVLTRNNYICRVFLNTAVERIAGERLLVLSAAEGFIVHTYSGHGMKPAGLGEILCDVVGIIHSESEIEVDGSGRGYMYLATGSKSSISNQKNALDKITNKSRDENYKIFSRNYNELGYVKELSNKFLEAMVSFVLG